MRKHLLVPVLLFLVAAYGCSQTPVQASAHDAQPLADELPASADSTGRGGNVMGGGH